MIKQFYHVGSLLGSLFAWRAAPESEINCRLCRKLPGSNAVCIILIKPSEEFPPAAAAPPPEREGRGNAIQAGHNFENAPEDLAGQDLRHDISR
jgi:hypothetical protein